MKNTDYIPARKSQLKFYKEIELFNASESGGFVLYKRSGITLGEMRLDYGTHLEKLYIKQNDKLAGLQEAQKGFNHQLKNDVHYGKRKILMTSQVIKILIVCQRDSCCRADGDLSLPELATVMPSQFPKIAKRNVDHGLGKTFTKKAQSCLALS